VGRRRQVAKLQELAASHERTEVTQRRRAEEALQESEARYRSLFERNPDAVYSFDLRGNFLEVNSACSRITGYLPEEFLKTSLASLMVLSWFSGKWNFSAFAKWV
jgi:PAS domain-containing protein